MNHSAWNVTKVLPSLNCKIGNVFVPWSSFSPNQSGRTVKECPSFIISISYQIKSLQELITSGICSVTLSHAENYGVYLAAKWNSFQISSHRSLNASKLNKILRHFTAFYTFMSLSVQITLVHWACNPARCW